MLYISLTVCITIDFVSSIDVMYIQILPQARVPFCFVVRDINLLWTPYGQNFDREEYDFFMSPSFIKNHT